jgi:TPP-dependent pyruvate/acetoin dehydrogenase alpha subunit
VVRKRKMVMDKNSVPKDIQIGLYTMIKKTRMTEERIVALYRQGQIMGGVYTSRGVEATTVGSAFALEKQDYLFPIHRDLGAHLAKGQSVLNILLQYLGKGNSLTKGKDSGIHASDKELRIVGNVSHLGAMIPMAIGAGMGKSMQGEKVVSMSFIGEGGSNVGDFHEGLNFAAVMKAPYVQIIENNQYAYSTPTSKSYVCKKLSDRALGYGIPGKHVDGTDALEVYATVKNAVDRARKGEGPTLVECKSMRMMGHSAHDDAKYVDNNLLKYYQDKDPINSLEKKLIKSGVLDEKKIQNITAQLETEIEKATQVALKGPMPEAHWAAEGVYAE